MAPHPWARHTVDTDESWALFTEWLHSSPRPSVHEWAELCAPKPVLTWAHVHLWEDRARAYDDHTRSEPFRKAFPVLSPALLAMLEMIYCEVLKYRDAYRKAGDAPGFFSLKEIAQWLRLVGQLERDARALSTAEKAIERDGGLAADFSKLTIEEMRAYSAIVAKMTNG